MADVQWAEPYASDETFLAADAAATSLIRELCLTDSEAECLQRGAHELWRLGWRPVAKAEEVARALASSGDEEAAKVAARMLGLTDERALHDLVVEERERRSQRLHEQAEEREFRRRLAKWEYTYGGFPNSDLCPRCSLYALEHTAESRARLATDAEDNEYAAARLARLCDVVVEQVLGEADEREDPEGGYKTVHAKYRVVSGDNTIERPTRDQFDAYRARQKGATV